jgi:hypothetical protein
MYERAQVIEKKSDTNKRSSAPKVQNTEFSPSTSTPADRILSLQRTIGNQAVQRLFKGVGGQRSAVGGQIQPKLTIGQPNDIYEQEADRVAEQVMRMPEPQVQCQEEEEELIQTKLLAEQITPLVQRQVEEEEQEEEEILQAKEVSAHTPQVTPDLAGQINGLRGRGHPLPESVRAFFEPRFGNDFSSVRVHTDSNASQMNRELNAQAFTHGRDIYFGAGRYNPGTLSGNKLIAHELTHVVQQENNRIQNQIECLIDSETIRLSPLSDELRRVWDAGNKGAFFDRLRNLSVQDADVEAFVRDNLRGDDFWLANNILRHGPEASWPIHLRVEREMKGWGDCGGKGEVFNILRAANGAEAGNTDLTNSLNRVFEADSDDIWLARNLQAHGPEASWPIHLRVEREMKGWGDCGGKGEVFNILRAANRAEAGNADLANSISNVFAAGTQDRWLAQVLQAMGPEASWPTYLTRLWADIQAGVTPVPPMEVSGAEHLFEEGAIPPPQHLYNCYEYAMGATASFRQPGGGVAVANRNRAGIRTLMTGDLGATVNCDTRCPSARRKIMMVVTDDAMAGPNPIVRIDTQPTRIIYWLWDFHFYRQDVGGIWSHKPGATARRLGDSGGARIMDPRTASRRTLQNTGSVIGTREIWRGIDYRNLIGCWCVARGTR